MTPSPSTTFRSLAKAFSHDADSPSGASLRVDFEVAGPSRDAEGDSQFQQPPLRKRVSVLTSEQQWVDLGGLSHAKVDDFSRFTVW